MCSSYVRPELLDPLNADQTIFTFSVFDPHKRPWNNKLRGRDKELLIDRLSDTILKVLKENMPEITSF
jgi:hypothetical protein